MDVLQDATRCDSDYPNLVLTVGSFDGVHLGHQAILTTVIERARERRGTAAVMSLQPHPKAFFQGVDDFALLSDPQQKESLLRGVGIDAYFILPFNDTVARMEPGEFLTRILVGQCKAVHLVVGDDFAFGAGARGNVAFIEREGPHYGLTVEVVPPVYAGGDRVSSTRIRRLVADGLVEDAAALLGRPFAIAGVVAHGRGMGKELGFPTANLKTESVLLPAHGIYAARVSLDGDARLAAVNIGFAPTLPHHHPVVEAHLLDFVGELSGRRIEVELHHRLRGEKKFEGLAALKEAIQNDIVQIRQYFAGHSA
jgi:riboflavin kinase/FMN adenylyltransferase